MKTRLLVQPDDSAEAVLDAIADAKRCIDMYIFRLDYPGIEKALAEAIARGVVVRTLIAHTSSGGEEDLRKLELRLLGIGATVSRTDEDLLRYHGKMMVVDRKTLYVLGYNFTKKDIDKSRSLGISTENPELVEEGIRLFEADFDRKLYTPSLETFVVSPLNARKVLMSLIEGAREQLLIYDARLTDNMMQRALEKQALAGVEVRVIGQAEKKLKKVEVEAFPGRRLHIRAMVQDGRRAFVGSQSLRRTELDRRREIGVIIDHRPTVTEIIKTFESDWANTEAAAG